MTIKSSSRFDRINKLDRDYWYWQILSLFCTLKARAKLAGIVNKVYWCIFSFQGVGKNKIADRFLHLLNRPREYIQLHRYKAVFKSWTQWCPSNSCQSHKMFFLFEVKCDWQSTSSFVTPTQTSRNRTPSEQASVQNKSSWAFWEKSYLLSVLVKKKEMNFSDDVQSSVFTINQLMNYGCLALLMLIGERPPQRWLRPQLVANSVWAVWRLAEFFCE